MKSVPIRKKLLLFLLIIFLPAFGIIVGAGMKQRNEDVLRAQNDASLLVESLAAQQEQLLTRTRTMLALLAEAPEVQSLNPKGCTRILETLNERFPAYSVLIVRTPDGDVVGSSVPLDRATELAFHKHAKNALRDLDFSTGEFGEVSKRASLDYAYPVLNANKDVIAMLDAGFSLDAYRPFVSKVNLLPQGSYVLYTDRKGMRLFRWPEDPGAPVGQPLPRPHFELISGGQDQGCREWISPNGVDRIYAFKQIRLREGLPPYLYILVGIPKQRVLHQANLQMLKSLSLLVMSTAVAMFLAWTLGNVFVAKPLMRLVAATQHFGAGEMSTRTGLAYSSDEIGRLAKSFDEMASLLEKRNAMVEQRTAELHAAVKQLDTARESAEIAALQDPLTKLANRRLLLNRLTHALKLGERTGSLCALLYLDLDRFKIINDSLGHEAGDELLVEVADRLQACLRQTDTLARLGADLVARLGGDEFAILLEGIRDVSDALRVADRIGDRLSRPYCLLGRDLSISASIGITISASRYQTPEAMLRDADTAMYRAKTAGRGGSAIFDETMHTQAVERLHLESELRQALEQQEFTLHYQPIVSLKDEQISGFEALLRWRSPKRGLVSPANFLSVAEETGLIVPIGAWVLHEACLQMHRWQRRFGWEPLRTMSVNLSAKQFLQKDLADVVANALRESGLEAGSLRLELTESLAMKEPERSALILNELQQLGVHLSLDDFGTGYSSMDHLHRFPVDTLKIDRHFTGQMETDERNQKIVRTMVNLAHNLRMEVIAEGAENAQQLALLRSMYCDYVQGYFYFKPMEAAELESLMNRPYDTYSRAIELRANDDDGTAIGI